MKREDFRDITGEDPEDVLGTPEDYDDELVADDDEDLEACPLGLCDGSGIVSTDEDDGEGHTARGVGSAPCPHTKKPIDDDDYEPEE